MDKEKAVLIIGAGYMAKEYYKTLKAFNINAIVFGRGEKNAITFEQETGANVLTGDYIKNLNNLANIPEHAIVAVNIAGLVSVTKNLIDYGIKNLLVEKPVSLHLNDIKSLNEYADKHGASVYVAYNRRYYASVNKALQIIKEDGGVTSFNFEFTEWDHVISPLDKPIEEKNNWLFSNSTHVLDMAFFLGGKPVKMDTYVRGNMAWHPGGCVYAGAGVTEGDALFSYQANWKAPGRWGVEILTNKHKLIFKPLEQLQIQELATVKINPVEIDDELDKKYKAGLYKMLESFLNNINDGKRLTLQEHINNWSYYEKIAGKSNK